MQKVSFVEHCVRRLAIREEGRGGYIKVELFTTVPRVLVVKGEMSQLGFLLL